MTRASARRVAVAALAALALACDDGTGPDGTPASVVPAEGGGQSGAPATELAQPLRVRVLDADEQPVSGAAVQWDVVAGEGTLVEPGTVTDAQGIASTRYRLGPATGLNQVRASVDGVAQPAIFDATATGNGGGPRFELVGSGAVSDRFTSDLWVTATHAYTGTWGSRAGRRGDALKIWRLSAAGTPTFVRDLVIPGAGTVSDNEVSEDGQLLLVTVENGDGANGLYVYSLADPEQPELVGHASVSTGLHTGTFASIGGRRYAFAARNPSAPALLIFDVTDVLAGGVTVPPRVDSVPVPADYGIHDTFVRDGIAFVSAWNTGLILYDVGNGMRGGSPAEPVEISRIVTSDNGVPGGAQVHNAWWFHNPTNGQKRYVFVGQEGPAQIGSTASGDIHVVDVSDLANPVEVASFGFAGAGTHNFWMDEQAQVLYAAYYNAGVVALDVSGELSGDLAGRLLAQFRPGGATNTYTWGVMLANGSVYASDMLSGLHQLRFVR
jgi:hypothetical protein